MAVAHKLSDYKYKGNLQEMSMENITSNGDGYQRIPGLDKIIIHHEMKKEVLEKLLAKYLSGESSVSERRELEKWYASFETDEGFVSKLSDAEKGELENKLLFKIDQNIKVFEEANTNEEAIIHPASYNVSQSKYKINTLYTYSYKIAAVFIGVVLLAGLAYRLLLDHTVIRSTDYGQTLNITLPDNSTVVLNGNSTLMYEDHWLEEGAREVYLDGEAFFSVIHTNSDQKFIVNTSDQFNVEVLGTKFNVSKRESGTRVVLNSGKVRLNFKEQKGNGHVEMKPGELVEFKDEPADYIKKEVNAEVYSSWKSNKLMLDNTSLNEIFTMLEENYGLKATVADRNLLDQKVSGSMPAENIDILLRNISAAYRIKIFKNKNLIEVRKDH